MSKTTRTFLTLAVVAMACFALTTSANAAIIGELGILDSTANGGINPATSAPWANGDTYRLFFVSANQIADVSTLVEPADEHALVQSAAAAVGLGAGTWYAIHNNAGLPITTAYSNAYDYGSTDVGIFMVNSVLLADDIADLVDGPQVAPNVTESGGTYNGHVATGFRYNGDARYMFGASGFTLRGYGDSSSTSSTWFGAGQENEQSNRHLYAISGDLTVIPEPATMSLLALGGLGVLLKRRRRRA